MIYKRIFPSGDSTSFGLAGQKSVSIPGLEVSTPVRPMVNLQSDPLMMSTIKTSETSQFHSFGQPDRARLYPTTVNSSAAPGGSLQGHDDPQNQYAQNRGVTR